MYLIYQITYFQTIFDQIMHITKMEYYDHYFLSPPSSTILSRKLRAKQPNQILLCLIISLLGLYTFFMLVIGLGPGLPRIPCGILAALLHFFALSSLAWMGIEGVNVYLLFVRIINSYIPRFIRKAAIFGWGKYLS